MSASDTPHLVRWRADLASYVVDGDVAYLATELDVLALEGQLANALVETIDGSTNRVQIVAALSASFGEEQVGHALDELVERGLLVETDVPASPAVAYYEAAGVTGELSLAALGAGRVRINNRAGVDTTILEQTLRAAGVSVGLADLPTPSIEVLLVEDYLDASLAAINLDHLDTGIPLLLARSIGRVVWSGPLIVPRRSPCWACLAHRLEANRQAHVYLREQLLARKSAGSTPEHPGGAALVAGHIATEVTAFLVGIERPAVLQADDLLTGESTRHPVTRRPQCPACGDPTLLAKQSAAPVVLAARDTGSVDPSGHRAIAPAAMLERYGDQVSPLTGVAQSLTVLRTPHHSLHVVMSGQNVARRTRGIEALRHGLRSASSGKGTSETQARASALGEAIERSSAVFQGDEPRRTASLAELGDEAIDPRACLLYSERQYELRSIWNAGAAQFNRVYEPFDETAELDWSPVWSLTHGANRWLPTQYLYYGYPFEGRPPVAHADSNGCAAGTSIEDAILQGICELFERDAVALWWYNRVPRPAVDLDSLGDPYVDRLRAIYLELGREVWALDLTSDFGVPAIGAFSRAIDGPTEDILIAFGAHLDPRVAITRALTEMNQFLNAVLPAFGGGPPHYSGDAAFADWCRNATLDRHPYLVGDPTTVPRKASSWTSLLTGDLLGDVERCKGLLESAGHELLVLDQTRPDVGLPVVKVIAPGLRHFWPRFAPGRLFDVPVELGWLDRPTPEEELNTVGIFI